MTYVVEGETHCYTPFPWMYTTNPADSNGTETGHPTLLHWLNQLTHDKPPKGKNVCVGIRHEGFSGRKFRDTEFEGGQCPGQLWAASRLDGRATWVTMMRESLVRSCSSIRGFTKTANHCMGLLLAVALVWIFMVPWVLRSCC